MLYLNKKSLHLLVVTGKKNPGSGIAIKSLAPWLQRGSGVALPRREFTAIFTEYLPDCFQIREIYASNLPEIRLSGPLSK